MFHQCLAVWPVIGVDDDTDARGEMQSVLTDTVGRAVNRYPKLSPFLFYPLLLLTLASFAMSIRQLIGAVL